MKIPKQLKCSGLTFEVIESEDIAFEGNSLGSTHFESQKVFLKSSLPDELKKQVLIHEIIHICLNQSGIDSRLERYDKDLEEDIVLAIEHHLYQILKDNKLFTF